MAYNENRAGELRTTPEITTKIDAEWRLQMQMERCAVTGSWDDKTVFEANINLLVAMLPIEIKNNVERRREEFTGYTVTLKYLKYAGHDLGTAERPHYDEDGNVISPVEVAEEYVDQYTKYAVVLEELEKANMTYRYSRSIVDLGPVKKKPPPPTPTFLPEDEVSANDDVEEEDDEDDDDDSDDDTSTEN